MRAKLTQGLVRDLFNSLLSSFLLQGGKRTSVAQITDTRVTSTADVRVTSTADVRVTN
jgi:hypothetical protein